ncbi:MAG TPA: CapA family protein [Leptolyngbyaceae cyanobacterium]
MTKQNVLTLAQQGDPDAIASLINQVIQKKGMTATAKAKGTCLHIVIVSDRVPEQTSCLRFVHDGMVRLNAKSVDSVRVYGRRSDQKWPSWTEFFELKQPVYAAPNPTLPRLEAPPAQLKRKPLKVKRNFRKKVSFILFGGICWILFATVGFIVRAKIDSQLATKSEQPNAVAQITPENAPKPQPIAQKPQRTGVPEPPKKTSPASATNQKLTPFIAPQKSPTSQIAPIPTQKPAAVSTSQPPATNADIISIKAVGDIVPGTNFPNNRLPSNSKQLFQNVKPYLQGADILFGNFESTLTNYPRTPKNVSRPMVHAFRTPPEYAKLMKETGFDVLSVANNHSLDFAMNGFNDTLKNIEQAGMTPVGKKNQIAYVNVKNSRVAFIGFSHLDLHNSINDLASAKKLVIEAKKNAEIVVISVHAGAEGTGAMRVKNKQEMFYGENRGNKVLFARTLIDHGADLVLGHGPHVPRAMELYKGKLIAYSLGNFVGYRTLSTWGALGQSLILDVKLNSQGDFVSGKIIPVQLDRRGIPSPDKSSRSVNLIRNLTKMDFPNTNLKIDGKGQILKQS